MLTTPLRAAKSVHGDALSSTTFTVAVVLALLDSDAVKLVGSLLSQDTGIRCGSNMVKCHVRRNRAQALWETGRRHYGG